MQDYPRARSELERALRTSENLNLQMMQARSHYLLATVLRLQGNQNEAAQHYASARTLLEGIRTEAKTDDLQKRSDVAAMYADFNRWAPSKS